MPIPIESESKEMNQEPSDSLISEIRAMLECGDENNQPIDDIIRNVTLDQIDRYIDEIKYNQDLPFQLLKIGKKVISDKETFDTLCDHSAISGVQFDPKLKHRVYFIETADNAIVLLPIQLERGVVNVRIELLERGFTHEKIYEMYQNLGKLKMKDVKFVKFNN